MPFNGMNVCAGKFMTQQSSEKGRFGLFLVFEKMKNEIFPCEYSAPVCTNDYRLRRFSKYGLRESGTNSTPDLKWTNGWVQESFSPIFVLDFFHF